MCLTTSNRHKKLRAIIEQIRKSVVFLGEKTGEEKIRLYATGFLLKLQNTFQLATAKHVVVDEKTGDFIDDGMLVLLNKKSGGMTARALGEQKKRFGFKWVFHENEDVDIAIIPFRLDPQSDDIETIHEALFLGTDKLSELYDVFFLSYQPGLEPVNRIAPIIRSGTISVINDDRTFYIDGFAFPGNSGSPVFLKLATRFEKGRMSIESELGGNFIGVIGEYLPYLEAAVSTQTGRTRVVFEENTGLSKVWSVGFIQDILESDAFREQLDEVMGR